MVRLTMHQLYDFHIHAYSVLIQILVRLESRVAPFHVQHTWYLVLGTSQHQNRLQHQRYGHLFRAEKALSAVTTSLQVFTGVRSRATPT